MKPMPLLTAALVLAGCGRIASAPAAPSAADASGKPFAQASCGSCHAVGPYGTSPNPNAPPFVAVVNQEGLTAETLSTWLRDAHNYPREMQFELGPHEVDQLVAYMLTLQDPDYEPPIQ